MERLPNISKSTRETISTTPGTITKTPPRKRTESFPKMTISEEATALILACIYVIDSDNCINDLKDFKNFIKEVIDKDYHEYLKSQFGTVKSLFQSTIENGCKKIIELIFLELEKTILRQLFTT